MSDAVLVIRRFTAHEFSVRRLYATDPEFRIVCEDYADAVRACAVWGDDEAKARDYRQIIHELEDEILEFFEEHTRTSR